MNTVINQSPARRAAPALELRLPNYQSARQSGPPLLARFRSLCGKRTLAAQIVVLILAITFAAAPKNRSVQKSASSVIRATTAEVSMPTAEQPEISRLAVGQKPSAYGEQQASPPARVVGVLGDLSKAGNTDKPVVAGTGAITPQSASMNIAPVQP